MTRYEWQPRRYPRRKTPLFTRIREGVLDTLPGGKKRHYKREVVKAYVDDYETLRRLRDNAKTPYQRARAEAILHSSGCTGKKLFLAGELEADPHPDEEVTYDPKFPLPPEGSEETFTNIVQFPRTPIQS